MAAEALVSLLVENLGSLALQWIEEEVKLVKGVEGQVSNLKTNLEDIQAVLEDAEKKRLKKDCAVVKRWVEKLEGVSYDMDNVLDEWNTAILDYKIRKEEGEDLLAPKKEVCFPMPSCFCSPKVNRLGLRRDIALKVKDLNERLDRIAKDQVRYSLTTTTVEPPPYVPPTTSFIDEAKTFGRDEDKMNLVSKLLSESSHHEQGLQVISILGMGGLGKTTLARLAFNNEEVKAHFEQRIWVYVSDPFEETKIARAIIEAVEGKASEITALENLFQGVRKSIEGKKFLLVLDDVWTENENKWEPLKLALAYGVAGSRVLVTTRKEEVSRMMEVSGMIMLKKLSDEDCLLIFERLAFQERNEDEVEQLKEIGRKIAGKSKGLPLVAKTLGSLMRYKKTKEQWEDVLRSELWNSEDIEEKLFAPFLLSYYDLSAVEKRCFSYCSVFPKDHIIERSQLIEMWMSQGFLGHKENSVKKGHEYFEKLAMRSFFQDLEKSEYGGGIISCQMHDIVHDFAHFLTKNDCIIKEVDVIEESVKLVVDESARHLTLVVGAGARQCPALTCKEMNEKNLRTLFVVVNKYEDCMVDTSLFLKLKCLRTLNLSHCRLEKLPESIGELIHLRYLNLEWNTNLKELPGSLCNLCNLQTLNLAFCHSLRRLPEGMGKLVNLKHLYIGRSRLEGLPKGFGRLTSLQTLDALIVADDKEAYFDIGDLNKLKNLQLRDSLRIQQCRYFGNGDEAKKIDLKNKEHVAELWLNFGELSDGHGSEDDFAILEALEPHQNVASIFIEIYMGVTLSPRWMTSLKNLTDIHIFHCPNCETLPYLGKLPSLKSLTIVRLENVKTVGVEFLGISKSDEEVGGTERDEPLKSPMISFPNLESLEFRNMEQLEKWEGYVIASDTSLTIMPRLTTLSFCACGRLQALPDFLETTTTLKQLTMLESPILEECCRKRTGDEWNKISHIPNIKIVVRGMPQKTIWIQKDEDVVA
ncbi:hypothetical protein UlMin_037773 [Ulmus minor]